MEFGSEEELYDRLLPALTCKINEIKRSYNKEYSPNYLWKLLKEETWLKSHNLTLSEMVSDILNLNIAVIESYYSKEDII